MILHFFRWFLTATVAIFCHTTLLNCRAAESGARYFAIEVVDDQTGRGVPLIELATVSHTSYWTDSAGMIAIDDPELLDQKVFFYIRGPGYEYPLDGFNYRGIALDVKLGGKSQIKVKRLNIAERLYRTTGEGIYRDSKLLGHQVPIEQPLLNGQVSGQDSVQSAVYRGKCYWFWGDTLRPSYPLGHFWTAGATSELPGKGGLDPAVGVNLNYFVDEQGFSRPMLARTDGTPCWLEGLMTLKDAGGTERLLARSSQMKGLSECVARQLVVFDDKSNRFENSFPLPVDATLVPCGAAFCAADGGEDYCYFSHQYPDVRVKADWAHVLDWEAYEGFTCLSPGSRCDVMPADELPLERDANGKLVWGWKKNTAPLSLEQERALIGKGKIRAEEAWFRPVDLTSKNPVQLASSSVQYNTFRHCFVLIGVELGGATSFLGEVWYAEAAKPEGPWLVARKIVSHDRYSFYNPLHHAFLDQEDGRYIYFEGTYATTFSRQSEATPRYDYNQIMYRLDLADPRLRH